MSMEGTVCLNGDDDKLRTVSLADGRNLRFFGIDSVEGASVYATNIVKKGLWGSEAVLHNSQGESYGVKVTLPGAHMVLNATAAACVAEVLGLTPAQIRAGLEHVAAISGRNNLISTETLTLIDDCYNANPVSMKAGIDLLCMADTKKFAILGDMFELGENSDRMHAGVGEYAAEKNIDGLLCVGENSRHMYEAALKKQSGCRVCYFKTRDELLSALRETRKELLPDGCTVLIKASHGMHFEEVVELLKN